MARNAVNKNARNGGNANQAKGGAPKPANKQAPKKAVLPKPAPANFAWMTELAAEERSDVLKNVQRLVQSHDELRALGKGNYHNLYDPESCSTYNSRKYGLGFTRADIEAAKICKDCGFSKATIDAEKKSCMVHPKHLRDAGSCRGCGNALTEPGCRAANEHDIAAAPRHITQSKFYAPSAKPGVQKRAFVALDAEFIQVYTGEGNSRAQDSMVGWLAAIDGLTGEVLLNNLVLPMDISRIVNVSLKYAGFGWDDIQKAISRGTVIWGTKAMHTELAKHIDENTIIAGHATCNDLKNMRMGHGPIIDTQILDSGEGSGEFPGLGTCMQEKLGVVIQPNKQEHDPLEDAVATRELVLLKAQQVAKFGGALSQRRSSVDYDSDDCW